MTGQGQATARFRSASVAVEIRSINNRFLKVSSRLADSVAGFEAEIESIVRLHLRRGSISINIATPGLTTSTPASINVEVLTNYLKQANQAIGQSKWLQPVGDFFLLPGVLQSSTDSDGDEKSNDGQEFEPVRECLLAAIADLQAMRVREGAAMAQQFESALNAFRGELATIRQHAGSSVKEYETRLETKLRAAQERLGIEFDPSDVIREVTLFADKSDICEEVIRFESHIAQMAELLAASESPGRKLEFLIQEMHRETNTIGSKSYDSNIAASVIEMKTLIEQLREMVQNVE